LKGAALRDSIASTMGAPPPLPPRAVRKPPALPGGAPAPVPTEDGMMSTRAKMSLAEMALALRDEQLQARIVHYKADLQTSPELDAITAQVVAELQSLQKAHAVTATPSSPPADRSQIEIELIANLRTILGRLFRPDKLASTIQRKLSEVSKRFARLFFASELHEKMGAGGTEAKAMRHGEQALFHALSQAQPALVQKLDSLTYTSPEVEARAKEMLDDLIKEYRNQFLGRTTPELNNLVKILNEVLHRFFTVELPPFIGELAWEVVREARLADSRVRAGYKVSADAFPSFRKAFEKNFLQRLVAFCEDAMLVSVRDRKDKFRAETLRFVAEPQIFTDVCELIGDAVYDTLYNDGFLDLPADWRARLADPVA
jgi:hypothetical protein